MRPYSASVWNSQSWLQKPFEMNSMVILYGFYTFFSLFFKCCVKPKKESQYLNPAPYSESGLAGINLQVKCMLKILSSIERLIYNLNTSGAPQPTKKINACFASALDVLQESLHGLYFSNQNQLTELLLL